MSIKNILVAFDGSQASARAARLSTALARRYDAHLTGVFAHAAPYASTHMEAYLTQAAIDIMESNAAETEQQCGADFEELVAASEQGVRTSFLSKQGYPNDILTQMGRTYDLIVIAQPDGKGSTYTEISPDVVAMRSGRPVMIAPRGFEQFELAKGAIVAWDGERASSRALLDAMDVLEDKHHVTVLHVGHENDIRQPGSDVMEYLSRHGLEARLDVQPPGGLSTTDIILNKCAESDAGLLVMGAYEHSRFAEMLLGGVTRDVVARSHIPILMSH